MNLLQLPNVMLIEVFEYLSYEEVSKKRLVCRRIDQICQIVLNCGFNKAVRQHTLSLKRIKPLLPRRESERRNHCLARHADILTSIETRISMLSMTYSKYMDLNLCCFIPGRVLDEILRILRLITKTNKPLRPHEVLQELRDISSMAIEHFDEKIANTLKKSFLDSSGKSCNHTDSSRMSSSTGISGLGLGTTASVSAAWSTTTLSSNAYISTVLGLDPADFTKCPTGPRCSSGGESGCSEARATMVCLKKLELEQKKETVKMQRMTQNQRQQKRRLQQAFTSIAELNVQIVELKKRLEDVDSKNREISANIKQINTGDPAAVAAPENATTASVSMPMVALPTISAAKKTCGATPAPTINKRRHEDSSTANTCTSTISDDSSASSVAPKKPKV